MLFIYFCIFYLFSCEENENQENVITKPFF